MSVFPQIHIEPREPESVHREPHTGIITGVEVDGMTYFLKIIPPVRRGAAGILLQPWEYPFYEFRDDTVLKFMPEHFPGEDKR